MKKIHQAILSAVLLIALSGKLYAQTWIGVLPMQFNSSFAGSAGQSRLVVADGFSSYSYTPGNSKANSVNLSYDNFIAKLRTGIGFTFNNYYSNYSLPEISLKETTYNGSLHLSPKISINGKYTLAPSASINYTRSLSTEKIISTYKTDGTNWYYTTGVMFNAAKYYAGADVVFNNQYNSHFTYRISAGYTFQKADDSKFSFTPQLVYMLTPEKVYMDINSSHYIHRLSHYGILNFTLRYKNLIAGPGFNFAAYRDVDETIFGQASVYGMAGYQGKNFRLVYVQGIKNIKNHYTGQISFRYNFGSSKNSIALQN